MFPFPPDPAGDDAGRRRGAAMSRMTSDSLAAGPAAPASVGGPDRERGRRPARSAFSVVLPAFDEEQGLRATLETLRGVLNRCDRTYEIIVVDDGSTDATPRILATCADVRVVRHGENRGYGAALKAGIRVARHPLVVVMDADGTYSPNVIPSLVDRCESADMVVGARVGPNVQPTPVRSVAKWCFRQFAQWITSTAIPDLNSGLRVFRRGITENFAALLPDGFSFTTTITVASLLEQRVVFFQPVDYLPRIGRSKIRPIRDTARIARQLLRLGVRLAPLRTSLAVALPLIAVGASSAFYDLLRQGLTSGDAAWLASGVLALGAGVGAEQRVRRRRRAHRRRGFRPLARIVTIVRTPRTADAALRPAPASVGGER